MCVSHTEGVTDFDELFLPLESAKCHLEGVWSAVNLLHIVSDRLDSDRFIQLYKRAERAILTKYVYYTHIFLNVFFLSRQGAWPKLLISPNFSDTPQQSSMRHYAK